MRDFLRHLFVPRESNNYRAKILHHQIIVLTIAFLFSLQILFSSLNRAHPEVLGFNSGISTGELLILTNQERVKLGFPPLVLNEELSKAAYDKAKDMFAKDYWAHNSPDGLTPWVFIKNDGYDYMYAGENLARGFNNSQDVVNAWMASEKHKENIISPNYKEIGFAVVNGKLLGDDTVLVVQMFGSKKSEVAASTPSVMSTNSAVAQNSANSAGNILSNGNVLNTVDNVKSVENKLPKNLILIVIGIFIVALIIDMVMIEKKKIIRLAGHNLDHILFLGIIFIVIMFIVRGSIL